jgi:hypothetical protein
MDPYSLKNLKQSANTTFLRRWKGEDRLVALFHPIHEVAFLLDPFMVEAGQTLNASTRHHVRTILGKYCSSPAEMDATMLEFNEYIVGVGIFNEARQEAMAEAKERYARVLSAWRAEHQGRDPSHTQMAIMRCHSSCCIAM